MWDNVMRVLIMQKCNSSIPLQHHWLRVLLGVLLINIIGSSNVVSQNCQVQVMPDLPVISSTEGIDAEISQIFNIYKDVNIGGSRPSESVLVSADNACNELNIVVTAGGISGVQITSTYSNITFLKEYAKEYLNGSLSQERIENAKKTIWLICEQICNGSILGGGLDAPALYDFKRFSEPAVYFFKELDANQQALFAYAMEQYGAFDHFWSPVYDAGYMAQNDGVDTDQIYNNSNVLLAFCALQNTADERYLWMRGYKRWLERFTSYSNSTCNGLKPDGTGFHHWTAYDNYMYAFKSCCDVIYFTSGTSFQIEADNYKRFRDAVFTQIVHSNNRAVKPLSMSGRKPENRISQYSKVQLKRLAIAGGRILGLSTADPELASQYNRLFGTDEELNYSSIAPASRTDGFYQFNYANMGIYRKNGWLAGMKGFTNGLWGAELYPTANRYGRYQSYGTMEIVYEGNTQYGNGYNEKAWNWNYNPGATTRVLSWYDLNGEKARIDEYQVNDFAGALSFSNKNNATLNKTHGTIGMFAMNFQEVEDQGFSTVYHSNTHDGSFQFKKSTFVFDDMILCLGSDISSTESAPVVTTLFQRLHNKGDVIVNGEMLQSDTEILSNEEKANWVISNYNTGFYLPKGNNNVILSRISEKTPYHNQIEPNSQVETNTQYTKWIGYINHSIKPNNSQYEYVVIPDATISEMENLNHAFIGGNKPYNIHQQNTLAHVVEHAGSKMWAYAIFGNSINLDNYGLISFVSDPCMIMYHNMSSSVKVAISNPVFGIKRRSYEKEESKTISFAVKGKWDLVTVVDGVSIEKQTEHSTTFSVYTEYGYPYEFEMTYSTQPYVPLSNISLSTDLLELKAGQTEQLFANLEPVNATNKLIHWISDNPEVATVDADGRVTAADVGSTLVYATTIDGGLKASCTVEVMDINEYQAEDCTEQFGVSMLSDYDGYTHTGYAEYNGSGNWIEWNNVQSEGGTSTLKLRYSSISNVELEIEINGSKQATVLFDDTGDWLNWQTESVVVNLQTGNNIIRINGISSNKLLLDKMNIILGSEVSVNDIEDEMSIKTYPNPFSTHLKVNAPGYDQVIIYDLTGKELIWENIQPNSELHLKPSYTEMPPGLYFFKFISKIEDRTMKVVRY